MIDEPAEVMRYAQVRDAALHHSVSCDPLAALVAEAQE